MNLNTINMLKTVLVASALLLLTFLFSTAQAQTARKAGKTYLSKSDFVPGNKVTWRETFANESIGDFPSHWNTNAGGEVIRLQGKAENAFMISADGVYMPLLVNSLPQNFTLEFDLACNANFSYYSSPLQLLFTSLTSKKQFTLLKQYNPHNKDVLKLWLHPNNAAENAGFSGYELIEKGIKKTSNESNNSRFFAHKNAASVRVSIWRQDTRLRVYLDEEKVWDVPQAFDKKVKYNSLVFSLSSIRAQGDEYFLSNFRLATDTLAIKK